MIIDFVKYQGTGNDFVMIDDRQMVFPENDTKLIARLCDRRFGIGADGLILLQNDKISGFRMVYFNSDGRESSMCGNGGRCFVAFAKRLELIDEHIHFIAADGPHEAQISADGLVTLGMKSVGEIKQNPEYLFLNTGSPHHIQWVEDVQKVNVQQNGAAIRYGDLYGNEGSNVNFVQQVGDNQFVLRTYERGVEDETLSCGTGATAAAIAAHFSNKTSSHEIELQVMGGNLKVSFDMNDGVYSNVQLIGPAEAVFSGKITC